MHPALVLAAATTLLPVSGNGQAGRAYVATAALAYVTTFTTPLRVRVRGDADTIRFTCVTPGCTFPPTDVGDSVDRHDKRSWDAKVDDHHLAAIPEIITQAPALGPILIEARDAADPHAPAIRFTLYAR